MVVAAPAEQSRSVTFGTRSLIVGEERERERKKEISIHACICIYIYMSVCVFRVTGRSKSWQDLGLTRDVYSYVTHLYRSERR